MIRKTFLIVLVLAGVVFMAAEQGADADSACIVSACNSHASAPAGVIFTCPQGDGESLAGNGLVIDVTVWGCAGPVPGVPASDIWVGACDPSGVMQVCVGPGSAIVSGPTDINGHTTIIGSFAAGGCDVSGLRAVVQGVYVGAGGCAPCLPIKLRTPDINGTLTVDLADLALFGLGYPSPPQSYRECLDFAHPYGTISLSDLAKFGTHYQHAC